MAPITRSRRTKRMHSSPKSTGKRIKRVSKSEKKEILNDNYNIASDDSESTDSEMELLVEQTFQKMLSTARRKTKLNDSNSDTDSADASGKKGKESEDVLPFVLDINPTSKSDVRIEVDCCGTISNEQTNMNEVKIQFEEKDPSNTSAKQPQPVHTSEEHAEEEFISLDPGNPLSRDEQKTCGIGGNRKTDNGRLKEPDIRIVKGLGGPKRVELATELDSGLDPSDTYLNFVENDLPHKNKTAEMVLLKSSKDQLLEKSIITADFEKRHSVPPYRVAMRQLKRQKKKERESTTGPNWYGMAAAEMTDKLRNDIKAVRMRATLDPKRFYKHNDMTAIPKFIQVGTIVESPADFYHSRVPKKQRKQTIVEELLADAEARRHNKRKYLELQERSQRRGQRSKWSSKRKKKSKE